MAFYIKPPDGFGSLAKLRIYALRRINFLVEVLKCADAAEFQQLLEKGTTAVDSDCLIEGSRKDRISHFLLRLICCADAELSTCLLKAETELFCHRFASMNSKELLNFLETTYRFLRRLRRRHRFQETRSVPSSVPPTRLVLSSVSRSHEAYFAAVSNLLKVLTYILEAAGSWHHAVKLYMDYSLNVFSVPFQHALCLVASRQVMMDRGTAFVPFSSLHVVLASMFGDILQEGLKVARHIPHHFLDDARVRSISREVHAAFHRTNAGFRNMMLPITGDGSVIHSSDIDYLSQFFPPCMSHLHRTLRRKHRLRHLSRIQYTLFLKSIGLPVGDAILFWKTEYSKPSHYHDDQGGGCQHSWGKDKRRYTYSVRHLYGLEGSKTDYRAHSCNTLQAAQLGYGEEGGCPFKHFDDSNFQRMMDIEEIVGSARGEINMERQKGKYNGACKKFFHAKLFQTKTQCDGNKIPRSKESWQAGTCHRVGSGQNGSSSCEITDSRYPDECEDLTGHSLDVASVRTIEVKSSNIQVLEIDNAQKKVTQQNSNTLGIKLNDVQSTRHACEEGLVDEHSKTGMSSMEMDCGCDVSSSGMSGFMAKKRTAATESDSPSESAIEQTTLLQQNPPALNTGLGNGPKSESTHSMSMASGSTTRNKITGKNLKRESAIVSVKNRKVAKMVLVKKESDECKSLESLRSLQNDKVENFGCEIHPAAECYQNLSDLKPFKRCHTTPHVTGEKGDTRVAPFYDSDLLLSPSNERLKGDMTSNKIQTDEELGSTFEVDNLNILRPSDFYYSFNRMISGLNQTKH